MSTWLDEVRRALDAAPGPVSFFFRNDDAGWSDDPLLRLLDLFARYSMPLDVAAIPAAITPRLAEELLSRIQAEPERLAIHQHGFAHESHEPESSRKCEFGLTRESALQQRDIEEGKRRLCDLFGHNLSPIFTPPWNRCTEVTGECLLRAGFSILSRDVTATRLNLDGLLELPVTIDWFAKRRGVRLSPGQLGGSLAEAIASSAPAGLMFHHALMDKEELQRTEELLALLASHGNANCYLMERVAAGLPQVTGAQVPVYEAGECSVVMP